MGPLRVVIVVGATIGIGAAGAVTDAWPQTPQAVCSVLGGHPCHPSFCSVFHRGPCLPYYLPPIGEDLRLTVVSTDNNDPAGKPDADAETQDRTLDSISAMYAALRACWVPPP
jgi:hypothetical protein